MISGFDVFLYFFAGYGFVVFMGSLFRGERP